MMKKILTSLLIITIFMFAQIGSYEVKAVEADSNDVVIKQLSTSLAELGDTIIQLSFGHSHSSALTESGRVFMWGHNYYGQLGDGTNGIENNKLIPTEITSMFPSGDKVIHLSMGDFHSSAVTESGQVFVWGYNNKGQLGIESAFWALVPTNITENFIGIEVDDKVIQLSLGIEYSSALTFKGKVYTWGRNDSGQLGDKTKDQKTVPTEITGNLIGMDEGDKITQLSMGGFHSSALTQNGHVYMWGNNGSYQLSQGGISNNSTPTEITGNFIGIDVDDKIIQLSMGMNHSSALTQNGRVFTWGSNSNGQLGDGTVSFRPVPTNITGNFPVGDRVVSLSMANHQSSAVTESGRVFTWGYNFHYSLGLGSASQDNVKVPTNVTSPFVGLSEDKVVQLSLGAFHSSALTQNGQVYTWGLNNAGQLGDDSVNTKVVPNNITSYFRSEGLTMSFNSNGGTSVSSINAELGDPVSEPTAPLKAGYTFAGWYSDNALTLAYTFSTMPEDNITLYAKWDTVNYNISYHLDGGVNHTSNPSTYNIETATISLGDTTKTGYTFNGWYENSIFTDKSEVSEITQGSTGNIELYAKYTINQYTISFNSNDGTMVSNITQDYDTAVSEPTAPTKAGYTFGGWYADSGLTSIYTFTTMPSENMTLYAKWNIVTYDIVYNMNGGLNHTSNPETYNIQNSTITLGHPTKTGHTFLGWFDNSAFSGSAITEVTTGSTGDVTLYAKWSINTYMITFVSNGGSSVPAIIQEYNSDLVAPSAPTKTDLIFAGWFLNPSLTQSFTFDKMPAGNVTLYAKFVPNEFTATFIDFDGNEISSSTVSYMMSAIAPSDPERTGYTFRGWDTSFDSMTEDIIVEARYRINQYTATFKDYDGTLITTSTVNYLTSAQVPVNPTRTGYTFSGWDKTFNTMTENIEVKATYTINQYKAIFKDHDGSELKASTVDYLTSAQAPANPSRTGYTFNGWDVTFNSMTEDIIVTATYTINRYKAIFKDHDGSELKASTVDYLTSAEAPTNPSRLGYTFSGWDTVFNTMTNDIIVNATYTINQYTLSFNTQGGTLIANRTQDFNTNISLPEPPTKEGYLFNGWCQALPNTMPAEDIILNARWLKESQLNQDIETEVSGLIDAIDQSLIEGIDAEVLIQISLKSSSEIDVTESSAISSMLSNDLGIKNQGIIYLDIAVVVKAQGSAELNIDQLTQTIKITLNIPIDQQGYKNYQIVRIHDDIVEVLDSIYDEETQTLTFETDRFSTYAIFYDEGNASGLWWLLLLTLIPLGYFGYQYRGFIKGKSIIIMGKVKKVSHLIKSKVTK